MDADPLAQLNDEDLKSLTLRGSQLFAENVCATCHTPGATAAGVVVKPLEGLKARYTLKSLQDFLLTPQPPMPVVDLPEADRRALAVYLFSDQFSSKNR